MKKSRFNRTITLAAVGSILVILLVVAAAEIFDLPQLIFNVPSTPLNWAGIGIGIGVIFILFVGLFAIFCVWKLASQSKRAEELYKTMANSSQVGVHIVQDGKFQFVNPKFQEYSGFSQAELVGTDSLALVHPEDREMVRENAVKMLNGERSAPYEFRVITKDGKARWVVETGTSIHYNGGRAILGSYLDISDRKRNEEERARLNHNLLKRLKELRCFYSVGVAVEESNSLDEFLNGVIDLIPPAMQYPELARTRITFRGNKYQSKDFTESKYNISADIKVAGKVVGSLGIYYTEGTPFLKEEADLTGGLAEKISGVAERIEAREALRESEEKYRVLTQAVFDAIIAIREDGEILLWNSSAERMFGYTAGEAIGKELIQLIVPQQYRQRMSKGLNKFFETGTGPLVNATVELSGLRKNGEEFPIELSIAPVRIQNEWQSVAIVRDVTERKRMEEKLKESEERYRVIFENAKVGMMILEEDTTISLINPELDRALGYSREEVEGVSWTKIVHPDDVERMLEYHKKRREDPTVVPTEYEFRGMDKNGNTYDFLVNAALIPGTKRSVISLLDISERKRAEETLRESEGKYRDLADLLPQTVFEMDERGNLTFANRSAFAIFGYTQNDFDRGLNALQMLIPEDRDRAEESIQKVLSGEGKTGNEYTAQKKDGGTFPCIIYSSPIIHENKPVGLRGIIVDISERKRAEEEIKYQREYFRALFESFPEAVVSLDAQNRIMDTNPAFEKMFGYTLEDMKGRDIDDYLLPKSKEEEGRGITKRISHGEVIVAESVRKKADGIEIPVSILGAPITLDGKQIGVFAIYRDITERKMAEATLRESEERYRTTFEHTGTAMVILEEDSRISLVNSQFEKLSKYSREEIEGKKSWTEFVHQEDLERMKEYHRRRREPGGKAPTEYEFHFVDREGNIKNIFLAVEVILGTKKSIASLMDITEQKKSQEQLERSFIDLAETVSRAMSSRDPYTVGHQRRVAELARLVSEKMGLDKNRIQGLYIGGLLHDIGKISTPESILSKPGQLAEEEWALIHVHTKRGYEILDGSRFPWPVADMALHHHERLDGSGYPHGISGDKLSLENRILGVCDVVEAMSSFRPYRPARSKEEVLEEIKSGRGTKYDANVVDIVVEIIEGGEFDLGGKGKFE